MGTVEGAEAAAEVIRLRYAGRCACGVEVPRGERAGYVRLERRVVCLSCLAAVRGHESDTSSGQDPLDGPLPAPGTAGGGAWREHARRVARRQERLQQRGRLVRAIAAVVGEPQSTRAWEVGALGEERVGAVLEGASARGVLALHDRRIPGRRSNIDHIAIGPAGVFVIDTKRYENAEIRVRRVGGLFTPRRDELLVRGRVKTNLVEGLRRQVEVVERVLDEGDLTDVPVHGVLCFVDGLFPLFQKRLHVDELAVTGRRGLTDVGAASGPVDGNQRQVLYRLIGQRLPAMT
jgi:hypothetical protein